jgi:hypothetical protein
LLKREDWPFPQEIRLDQLAEFVTEQGNPGNEKRVTLAEVQLPIELLRLGVHFADTPGVASAIAANTRTTREFLPEADAAILVTSFESPMTEAELDFLREVRDRVRKVFVVVNKLDLISPGESGPVLDSVREMVRATLHDTEIEVFAVSAREGLLAKLEASPERQFRSGLPLLESALTDFLRRDKARELLLRAADRTAAVAHQEELAVRISEQARSPEKAEQLERCLAERMSDLTKERESLLGRMRDRLRAAFPRVCERKIGLWDQEDEVLLTAELRGWLARGAGEIRGSDFETFLHDLSQRLFSRWLTCNRSGIDQFFEEAAQEDSAAVEALAAKIQATPAEVLGGAREGSATALPPAGATGPPEFSEPQVLLTKFRDPWWLELLPAGRPRDFLVQRWLKRVPEFVQTYQRAVFTCLEKAADDWVNRLDRELADRTERMRAHVSALLLQPPETADLPEIENVLDHLREMVKAAQRMTPAEPGDAARSLAETPRERPATAQSCPICVRIERALFDFMARYQYELSTEESEQRRHALRSGFCPLHTWQFEAVASPQGICSGYPVLLTLLAKKLRLLAGDSTSVLSIANGVRSLLPKETLCPACQLAARVEQGAARDIARQLPKDDQAAAGLCTFHLRAILLADPGLVHAKRLLLAQALAFESLAEDMQNYVLKHEAVRRHLSTNAERRAALAGLTRLAGRRNVVAPWRTE